ncbi:BglII/BstYI family type II restriction endonuclease [Dactylococcopsis salina]|uniref:Restriction endonuclease BglII n=1 Tax=Dactylococcopsis salina (strain PCC 8305) TaxID=13035 RepID=K9YV30_DACS8|nr:BglII/BstYI family type II restriction endonuclease [Dactylococcopsis salina]AFZ49983.1 Restriction endonuclease BglII [Dactylococcopsis salina PCC 8305]
MIVAGEYSFNGGKEKLESDFSEHLREIKEVIKQCDSSLCKKKKSKEKTKQGQILYSPKCLNDQFARCFQEKSWGSYRIPCSYSSSYYTSNYQPQNSMDHKNAYREMDFIKGKVGVEVQFGKYSFMVYNVCAKMTIFSKKAGIKAGVEIVPIKDLAVQMSTGVSYFEQIVWDLEQRGVSNIDIPVLIIGIMVAE